MASRRHASTPMRDATRSAKTPTTAYTAWRCTNTKLSPYAANAETELADSTITSPVPTRNAVEPRSNATDRRERASACALLAGRSFGRTSRRWCARGEAARAVVTS